MATLATSFPPITAARRAFCLTFPVTQRDAVDRRTSRPVECERSAGGHSRSLAGSLPSGDAAARRLHRARPDAPYAATDIADMLARPLGHGRWVHDAGITAELA